MQKEWKKAFGNAFSVRLILSGTVSSLQGRRLEVFGARKNGEHEGEMWEKRDHPPEKPMKIVRKIPVS